MSENLVKVTLTGTMKLNLLRLPMLQKKKARNN